MQWAGFVRAKKGRFRHLGADGHRQPDELPRTILRFSQDENFQSYAQAGVFVTGLVSTLSEYST